MLFIVLWRGVKNSFIITGKEFTHIYIILQNELFFCAILYAVNNDYLIFHSLFNIAWLFFMSSANYRSYHPY